MPKTERSIRERRSGKDRRSKFSLDRFFYGEQDRRRIKDRRSRAERRKGWVRISKWSSVYLSDLKISKFLK